MPPSDISPTEAQKRALQKVEVFKQAEATRRFEIERLWQRSIFFWGFIAAAFVTYGGLSGREETDPTLLLIVACFGLVCSVAWTLQNRGGKYWQEAYEQKVNRVEVEVLGEPVHSRIEPLSSSGLWGARRYSASKLAIALSDFTALLWVLLTVKSFPWPTQPGGLDVQATIILAFTLAYVVCLLVLTRSKKVA